MIEGHDYAIMNGDEEIIIGKDEPVKTEAEVIPDPEDYCLIIYTLGKNSSFRWSNLTYSQAKALEGKLEFSHMNRMVRMDEVTLVNVNNIIYTDIRKMR